MGLNEIIKIGTRIKRIRIDKKMSQKFVAEQLGIPYSTYSNYENNNREPNYNTLKRIANILNVTIPYLLYGETGIMSADTAEYLLSLSGFELVENDNGTYTICDIENNKTKNQVTVTINDLQKLVYETSDYITFLTQKLFQTKSHSHE